MIDFIQLTIKNIYPRVKFDNVERLNAPNKRAYIVRNIDKNKQKAFKNLQSVFAEMGMSFEVKNYDGISKGFPYVILVKVNKIQYMYTVEPDSMSRLNSGSSAQDKFEEFITLFDAHDITSAKIGTRDTDISFVINGKRETAEIKSTSLMSDINAFDITVYRSSAKLSASKDIAFIDELIYDFTKFKTLESYIDDLRKHDTTIGYSGDQGVKNVSGSLPAKYFDFIANDRAVKTLKDHWKTDDYFIVLNGSKFFVFNTHKIGQLATEIEKLAEIKVPIFSLSHLKKVSFKTYGTTRPGTIRLKMSISLNSSNYIEMNDRLIEKINKNI